MINTHLKKIIMMACTVGALLVIQGCDSASEIISGGKTGGVCTGTGQTYKCQGRTCTALASGTGVRCEGGQICLRANSTALPVCPS